MDDTHTIAARWYEALGREDVPAAIEICAPDVEIRYPTHPLLPYGGAHAGPEGVEAWATAHDQAEEILELRIEGLVAAGPRALAVGVFRGRARDSGHEWETRFAHVLDVAGGRLRSFEAFFDTAAAVEAHRA